MKVGANLIEEVNVLEVDGTVGAGLNQDDIATGGWRCGGGRHVMTKLVEEFCSGRKFEFEIGYCNRHFDWAWIRVFVALGWVFQSSVTIRITTAAASDSLAPDCLPNERKRYVDTKRRRLF